ncbi:unnamed protein product [Chondrus crispus]|uniref:Uncharacterized protein n=1 Tax=Chondrus crispus TaxID=2769 RepID=R7QMA2_CHOCR|nr:unnamed protein product [Chondrus crispus]CDF38495.1 unnamed protein product [Chondrus crispus]|eukprot:XP_005718388.1 unnamed protein product [Chondrus crispus]
MDQDLLHWSLRKHRPSLPRLAAAFLAATSVPTRKPTSIPRLCRQTPTCLAADATRRRILQLASVALATTVLPTPARSESTYEKKVRKNVARVSLGRAKAQDLKIVASSWKEDMSEDDQLYVLRFIPIWLEPARLAMAAVGTQENVDIGDAALLKNKAAESMGHLLELRAEAKGRKKAGVLRELDEWLETLDDFLKLQGVRRFVL